MSPSRKALVVDRGRRALRLLGLVAVVLASCGRSAPIAHPGEVSAYERDYPVLRWVPADVTYALVGVRAVDLATALRELFAALRLLGADDLGAELSRDLGINPLRSNDLVSIGLSLEGGAALFSTDLYPTLLLPIADVPKLTAFLDKLRPERNVVVRRRGGYDIYSWRAEEDYSLSWVIVDDWLAIHAGINQDDPLWFDGLMAVPQGRGLGSESDFAAVRRRALAHLPRPTARAAPVMGGEAGVRVVLPAVVGLVRLDALRRHLGDDMPEEVAACIAGFAPDARFFIGANVGWNHADGVVGVDMRPAMAAALSGAVAPLPPPGYRAFSNGAGLHLDLALNLAWLRDRRDQSGCYLVLPMRATDRLLELVGGEAVSSYHLAGSDFGILTGTSRSALAAGHLALRDRAFADRLLDMIPQRRAFEKVGQRQGQKVRTLDVPLFPALVYQAADDHFTATLGGEVADIVFAAPAAGPAPAATELVRFGIYPGRVSGLRELVRLLATAVFDFPARLDTMIGGLGRYEHGHITLSMKGRELIMSGAMRLR